MSEAEILPAEQFNYNDLDAETRIVVQQRTSEIKTIARRAAGDIIEIGSKLIEVKERLGHGKFGKWLSAEFGWSQDSAANFMRVTAKFGQIPNISEFAPTALYMLSAPSIPEEARAEAVQRAEAGERITVVKAQEIVREYKPIPAAPIVPAFQAAEALQPVVLDWLATLSRDPRTQRGILNQISLGNAVGLSHLDRLAAYIRRDRVALTSEIKRAVMAVLATWDAPAAVPTVRSTRDPEELADEVTAWLLNDKELDRATLEAAYRMTGSLLDLEGIHARTSGRNFDWEALVGYIGADVDHTALRAAIASVRAYLGERIAALPDTEPEPQPEPPEIDLPGVVRAWLDDQIQNNDIADEPEARRNVLAGILTSHSNGYKLHWRSLKKFPQWPDGTEDGVKLNAVRAALATLGAPVPDVPAPGVHTERPTQAHDYAPRIANQTDRLIARKDEHIHDLLIVNYKATGWLKSYLNGLDDPDETALELLADLERVASKVMGA